jgi:hypothetical protein
MLSRSATWPGARESGIMLPKMSCQIDATALVDTECFIAVDDADIVSVEDCEPPPYEVYELNHEPSGLARRDELRPPICEAPPAVQPRWDRRVRDRLTQRRYSAVVVIGGMLLGFGLALALFRVLGA